MTPAKTIAAPGANRWMAQLPLETSARWRCH